MSCQTAQGPDIEARLRRIHAVDEAWKHRADLRTYGLTYRSWFPSFKRLFELFNDAWAENWGATPISGAEVDFIAKLMLPVIKPAWIRVAEWQGEPIGIVAHIPNANEAFADLKGKLLPFGWWHLVKRFHITGTRTSRIPIAGSVKKWRNTYMRHMAIARMMLESFEFARAKRVEFIEMSWVLETNVQAIQRIEFFGSRPIRKFRLFERPVRT